MVEKKKNTKKKACHYTNIEASLWTETGDFFGTLIIRWDLKTQSAWTHMYMCTHVLRSQVHVHVYVYIYR